MDKTRPLTLPYALLAVRALAHLHGAWWRFLNDPKAMHGRNEAGFSLADANTVYKEKMPLFMLKGMLNNTFKSLLQLMKNRGESM